LTPNFTETIVARQKKIRQHFKLEKIRKDLAKILRENRNFFKVFQKYSRTKKLENKISKAYLADIKK